MFRILKIAFLASLIFIDGIECGKGIVVNNCPHTIKVEYRRNENGILKTFQLGRGQNRELTFPNDRVGWRVWAHLSEDTSTSSTLAEFSFDPDEKLWYNISQVDGYTFSVKMEGMKNSGGNCAAVRCVFNINNCPSRNRILRGKKIIACKNLDRDSSNTDYVRAIKKECPNAYAWSKDDKAMRDCMPGHQGLRMTFC